MNSTSTPQDHDKQRNDAVERELHAVQAFSPPADLLDRLQDDLANAVDEEVWDQEPAIAPFERARPNWWQSPSLRAAAAILTVVGAGWFLSRMGLPDGPVAQEPSSGVLADATAQVQNVKLMNSDLETSDRGTSVLQAETAREEGAPTDDEMLTPAGGDQSDFFVDGVSITDMRATGASPNFYDFDQFAEVPGDSETPSEGAEEMRQRQQRLPRGLRPATETKPDSPRTAKTAGDKSALVEESAGIAPTSQLPADPSGLKAEEVRNLRALGYLSAVKSKGAASEPGRRGTTPSPEREPPAPHDAPAKESLSVTSEAPLLDEKKLTQGAQITQAELDKIPTKRDSWAVLNQTPGVPVDRVNVGGSESGQQAVFREPSGAAASAAPAPPPAAPRPVSVKPSETKNAPALRFKRPPAPGEPISSRANLRKSLKEAASGDHEKIFVADAAASDVNPRHAVGQPRRPLAEFDAMNFRDFGISPFVDPKEDAESTFGLDVDTGSYTIARSYLNRGALPPPESVRVEEFLNALDFKDEGPRRGDFAITAEGALSPYPVPSVDSNSTAQRPDRNGDVSRDISGDTRRAWLRVGVKAKSITAQQRKPTALTFLVDTSGSMAQENRIEIVKQSLRLLVDELTPRDTVAIVTYGSRGQVLLEHSSEKAAILSTIDRLFPQGSTNLQEGMEHAYRLASENLLANDDWKRIPRNHRVLLLSDGVANVGLTDAEALLRNVAHWAARGIELTAVGVGMGNYNDELLERLADRGDGRYAYVDRLEEARRLFVENLTGTLQTVGKDARVQVTFDPAVVRQYRLVGYENRDIPDAAFRNKNTDGGEIGADHAVTALYELDLYPSARRRADLATIALVYRPSDSQELVEIQETVQVDTVTDTFASTTPSLRLATLTARFAELLRVSPHVEGDLSSLFLEAQQLIPEFPGDRRVVELADLIGKARDLMLAR